MKKIKFALCLSIAALAIKVFSVHPPEKHFAQPAAEFKRKTTDVPVVKNELKLVAHQDTKTDFKPNQIDTEIENIEVVSNDSENDFTEFASEVWVNELEIEREVAEKTAAENLDEQSQANLRENLLAEKLSEDRWKQIHIRTGIDQKERLLAIYGDMK